MAGKTLTSELYYGRTHQSEMHQYSTASAWQVIISIGTNTFVEGHDLERHPLILCFCSSYALRRKQRVVAAQRAQHESQPGHFPEAARSSGSNDQAKNRASSTSECKSNSHGNATRKLQYGVSPLYWYSSLVLRSNRKVLPLCTPTAARQGLITCLIQNSAGGIIP